MLFANSLPGALYEALVDPGKGVAAARRDYRYERYVSGLEERGIGAVDLRLTFPDPDRINPFFYLPRFHVRLSPHTPDSAAEETAADERGYWWRTVVALPGIGHWFDTRDRLDLPVHGNKPKSAYENASEVFQRWLDDLEERGFVVHKDYEFPRGLQDEIPEAERAPW